MSAVTMTVFAQEKGAPEPAAKAEANEQKVTLEQLPAAAREALVKLAGAAKLEEVTKESENGMDVYEGEWTVDGKDHEACVTADGSLLEMEESVAASDLPSGVQKALAKAMPGVEKPSYVKKTIIVYEAEGRVNGKQHEVMVTPVGGVVDCNERHGEQKHDDEEDDDD